MKWARLGSARGVLGDPPQVQSLPQYRPGSAVRPSLSPRGRKKGGEREGSEVTREGCVGWAETAVVLCHGEWSLGRGGHTEVVVFPEPRGFRKLAKIAIVSLGSGSAPPSLQGARTAGRLLCRVPATEDQG